MPIAYLMKSETNDRVVFHCPGCKRGHYAQVAVKSGDGPVWDWNKSLDKPTFSPSILVQYNGPDAGVNGAPQAVCHSFVKDGQIQFLSDCTHELAGKTVPLEKF